jgi:hypothetical protein
MQIIAALLLVLFLVGCSGAPSETKEDTSAQKSGDNLGATPSEPAKTADQPTATKGLKDILGAKLKYKAEYKITSDGETSTVSMAYDLPKFSQSTKMEEGESKTIFDGESFIICSKDDEWQCFKMKTEAPDSVQTEDSIRDGSVVPKAVGSCKVAGESGLKYEVTAEGVTSSICYTTDGILLEMTTEGMSMTATSVSRSVAASEFVPPAEPQDLSAFMQNIPTQ